MKRVLVTGGTGKLTCPDEKGGTMTWAEWVRETYAKPLVAQAGVGQ